MSAGETRISGTMEEVVARPRLGRLRRVEAREVWADAGGQLISSLRSNPELLAEALRLEIRPTQDEAVPEAIGELTPGLPVVVKARFEDLSEGDVRELAGLVADLDAGVLVLLAPKLPDPLRQRLDKLNRNTARTIVFYGVELDVWQIDDSAPAPMFRVVTGPEGWDRSPAAGASTRGSASGEEPEALRQGAAATAPTQAPARRP